MQFLMIKNFERFQHYKNRNPPWIKLYSSITEDYAFCSLPDASKAHLMLIWLLASKTGNEIPRDPRWVKNRIGVNEKVDLDILEQAGFLVPIQFGANRKQDASNMLSGCYQDATHSDNEQLASCKQYDSLRALARGETERERERETEPPIVPHNPPDPKTVKAYPDPFEAQWFLYPKRNGSNDKKLAFRCWNARLASGHSEKAMYDGVRRYKTWCEKTGKIGTETVMQASRFFGPADPPHFTLPWDIPLSDKSGDDGPGGFTFDPSKFEKGEANG